jgi:hypothetical protein
LLFVTAFPPRERRPADAAGGTPTPRSCHVRTVRRTFAFMADATHSYYDWQVSTLMLAYDAVDPIPRSQDARLAERQQAVEKEIHALAHATIPAAYRENPRLEYPPAVIILLTRATLKRAAEVVGL